MHSRSLEELREELNRLMEEQIESLTDETFEGLDKEKWRQQEARLKCIREVSADYIAAWKRNHS